MRLSCAILIAALLLSACGQPDAVGQIETPAAYPAAIVPPYPGPTFPPYPAPTVLPLSAEQIAQLQVTNLPPCSPPTATPIATETPPPTGTPAPPGTLPATPFPTPSPAPFPGDFVLTLNGCVVQGSAPPQVLFSAALTGGPDNSYEMYCVSPDWAFGDGAGVMAFVDCFSWSPDVQIQRVFTTDYIYNSPGTYQARLKVRDGTLESNNVTVEVR